MKTISQGESTSFKIALRDLQSLTGYECKIQLREKQGALLFEKTTQAVSDDEYGEVFIASLTPSESETLTVGDQYTLAAEVSNQALSFSKEVFKIIKINPQKVF